jgi:hypothetical protein
MVTVSDDVLVGGGRGGGAMLLLHCSSANQSIITPPNLSILHTQEYKVDTEAWSMSPLHVLPYFAKRLKKF